VGFGINSKAEHPHSSYVNASLLRKKSLAKREHDPDYGWLTVNTLDFKPDSKLSKSS